MCLYLQNIFAHEISLPIDEICLFAGFHSLYNTISSVLPEVKSNTYKRCILHLMAHKVLESQCKKKKKKKKKKNFSAVP